MFEDMPNWVWFVIFATGAWCFIAGRKEGISYEKKRRAEEE
jgi:uncharacterized membrane protein